MYYKMAETDNDWAAAYKLLRSEGAMEQELGVPTILAFNDEKLIGFIATTPNPDMIVGGPLVLCEHEGAPFTAARLAILYQKVLLAMGVERIIFSADEVSSPFGRGMKRLFPNIEPYAKKGTMMFYSWPLAPELQRSA